MLASMQLHRPTLVSEEEFLALPESMERVELLDGEVIVSPSPSVWHQELLARLAHALRSWADGHSGSLFIGQAPLDVRFAPGRILQPDLFVTLDKVELDHQGPLELVPDLCVEVLSTNRAFDRLTKRLVYGEAGVRELWLIEPSGVVERWSGQGLGEAEVLATSLTTPLLSGFEIELAALFRKG
jgi:Uma2 family endonuclease